MILDSKIAIKMSRKKMEWNWRVLMGMCSLKWFQNWERNKFWLERVIIRPLTWVSHSLGLTNLHFIPMCRGLPYSLSFYVLILFHINFLFFINITQPLLSLGILVYLFMYRYSFTLIMDTLIILNYQSMDKMGCKKVIK